MSLANQQIKLQGLGMFGAAVIWGTWVLVLNGVTLPGFFVTAITSFTGFLGLFVFIFLSNKQKLFYSIPKNRSLFKLIALVALLEAFQNALFMGAFTLAIQDGGSVFIPIIRSLIGIVTPIIAILAVKKEYSSRYFIYGAISTMGAIIIFSWGGLNAGERISYLGLGLVFMSVVISAIQNLVQRTMALKMVQAKQDEAAVVTYQSLLSGLFLLPLIIGYLAFNTNFKINNSFVDQLLFIGVFGFTHVALAFILRLKALRQITAQQAVIIGYLEPVTSIALSIIFLYETINFGFVIGGIIILTSAIMSSLTQTIKTNNAH